MKIFTNLLLALAISLLPAMAQAQTAKQPVITIVQGESPGGGGVGLQNQIMDALRNHYEQVNVISVGNCDRAAQIYNSINDTPVAYMYAAEFLYLKDMGMHTCGVKVTPENIWMHAEMTQGFCTKGPGPVTFEDFKKSKTFASILPQSLTDSMVDQINKELKTDIKKIPYNGGSGLALTAILNGEVDFAPIALFRIQDMLEDKRVACFAKYSKGNDKLPGIREFIPGFTLGNYVFNNVGVAKNMNAEQLTFLRNSFQTQIKKGTVLRTNLDKVMWELNEGTNMDLYAAWQNQENILKTAMKAAK
jgi:hypothetical protein